MEMTKEKHIGIVATADIMGGAEKYVADLYSGVHAVRNAVLLGRLPGWSRTELPETDIGLGPKWSRSNALASIYSAPFERHSALCKVRSLGSFGGFHLQYKREQILLTRSLAALAPVLWTEHGRFYTGRGSLALRWNYRRAATATSAIVCVSTEVADDVCAVVPRNVRVEVIVSPVDMDVFKPASQYERERLRRKWLPERWQDQTIAVLASRLDANKRHDRAIHTAISAGMPLLVVGDGPDRHRLEGLALGHDVVFFGFSDCVPEILRLADVYLYCASYGEGGSSLAVLEAAASGLLVIGYRGDTGERLVTKLGGSVLSVPTELDKTDVSAQCRNNERTRPYGLEEHSIAKWRERYSLLWSEVTDSRNTRSDVRTRATGRDRPLKR